MAIPTSPSRWSASWRPPVPAAKDLPRHAATALALIGLVAAYAIAAKLGQQFATTEGGVTAVWPASGIALAALLRFGSHLWPAVLLGATLASVSLSASLLAAGAEGVAATAQVLLAIHLLDRAGFNRELRRLRDVGLFFGIVPLGAAVAAAIGVAGLAVTGMAPWSEYLTIAFVWFIGDSIGALVIAPAVLVWSGSRRDGATPRVIEATALSVAVVVLGLLLFAGVIPALAGRSTPFAMVPLVVWAALRFGRRGTVAVVAVISVFVVGNTVGSSGWLQHGDLGTSLLVAQLFVGVLAGMGLSLAAVGAERRAVSTALRLETAKARGQQRFLQATLDNLDEAIVACDAKGRLTLFNRSTRELHGLPPETIPPDRWAEHYKLYGPDGTTLMSPEQVPLIRALHGEHVREAEMVIVSRNGTPRRLLVSGQPITSDGGERLGAVVAMHDVTERRVLEEQLRHHVFHDPLTGLANRILFADRLEHALVRRRLAGDTLAMLFLDIDDFKAVNDTIGRDGGDEVLTRIATRLRHGVRAADTVGRFGGDEFAILLEASADGSSVLQSAERILHSLRRPLNVRGADVSLAASMGIAFSTGTGESAETLLREAELAMYRAKEHGKGRYEVFESGMRTAALEELEMKADLRRALERHEFSLYYQPIVDLASGAVVGVEALLRWMHPARGMIAPDEFIRFAERTGTMVPIGRWVLTEACRQAALWQRRARHACGPLTLNVNLSSCQLMDPDFEDDVIAALHMSGLAAESLTLEITESMLIENPEAAIRKLSALKSIGIHIAIDDFGTGYSSLSYLTRLPIDTLKIDKAFVNALEGKSQGATVAGVVIELCRALKLEVIAEGVERREQADALRQLGCKLGQGYLFARPVEATVAGTLIAKWLPLRSDGERGTEAGPNLDSRRGSPETRESGASAQP